MRAALAIAAIALAASAAPRPATPPSTPSFGVGEGVFLRDGAPFQIIAGRCVERRAGGVAGSWWKEVGRGRRRPPNLPCLSPPAPCSIHYTRIHPDQWDDRLTRLKALGLNTVSVGDDGRKKKGGAGVAVARRLPPRHPPQTYVPWNAHEAAPGVHDWAGFADLDRFLSAVAAAGLLALVRPGPYICAEWAGGGLPAWLHNPAIVGGAPPRLRSSDPAFLDRVDAWWGVLLPRVARHAYARGGPVIAVQVWGGGGGGWSGLKPVGQKNTRFPLPLAP